MENQKTVIAVVGPTASGKSGMAVELALKLNGEIISCDSMQVYKGMDIATAKVTENEMKNVKHHLLDIVDFNTAFSVSDYVELCDKAILDIVNRAKMPILTGGTGLYARSLLYGIEFDDNSRDEKLREDLTKEYENGKKEELYSRLLELDPKACETVHMNNGKRLIRALEYCITTGKKISQQSPKREKSAKYNFLMICLNFRDRQKLYDRINKRVDIMMDEGLLDEALIYHKKIQEEKTATAMQAIGYKELFPYFDGKVELLDAVENIKRETRRYAKRQLTWFKKEENIEFVYVDDFKSFEELFLHIQNLCINFLKD